MTDKPAASRTNWISEGIIILVLIAVAFTIGLLYILQIRSHVFFHRLPLGTDMVTYDEIARKIARGDFLAGTGTESPLYPRIFLPLVYLATGGDLLFARLVQAALQAFNVLLIYVIAKRLFARPTGLAAAVIAIFYVPFIVYSGAILSETLLNTTLLLMMLMLLDLKLGREETAPASHFLLAGLTLGLAAAAKPTVVVFAPFALLWVVLHARGDAKHRIERAGIYLGGAGAAMIPFVIWGWFLTGSLMPLRGNSGTMFLMGNNPTATGAYGEPTGEIGKAFREACKGKSIAEQDRIAYRMAFHFIRQNPGRFAKLLAEKTKLFWGREEVGNNLSVTYHRQISFLGYPPFLSFGLILPAAIIGAFLAIPRVRTVWLLYAFIVIYSAAIILFIVVGRYRLAVVPFLIIFAGHCCAMIGRWFAHRQFRPAMGTIALMAALMLLIYSAYLWRVMYPIIEGPLSSLGCSWRVLATDTNQYTIKDDTHRPSPYGVVLTPPMAARKTLYVPDEILARAEKVVLTIDCAASRDAKWRLGANGAFMDVPTAEGQPGGVMGTMTVPLKPAAFRPGENEIVVEPTAGAIRIALDDCYDFDRSAVRDAKGNWRTERLDAQTCRTYQSLHIADGEFRIRLEISVKPQITVTPSASDKPA
ncbi:MAG: glycosyltransferase family 39 protein [Planctomycetota bacterium]